MFADYLSQMFNKNLETNDNSFASAGVKFHKLIDAIFPVIHDVSIQTTLKL